MDKDFQKWLESDEGVARYNMVLKSEFIYTAKIGWDAALSAQKIAETNNQPFVFPIGKIYLSQGTKDGKVWIGKKGGEGGDFSLVELEELIRDYYERHL